MEALAIKRSEAARKAWATRRKASIVQLPVIAPAPKPLLAAPQGAPEPTLRELGVKKPERVEWQSAAGHRETIALVRKARLNEAALQAALCVKRRIKVWPILEVGAWK